MPYINKEHRDKMLVGLDFQLRDLSKKESYTVWNNNTSEFHREGQLTDMEGNVHELNETKFMKADEFKRLFPGCNKNNKIERMVIIDGQEFTYPMPKSVDDQVEQTIAILNSTGINALQATFKVSKTGSGLSTRYQVAMGGQSTPVATPSPQPTQDSMPIVVEEINATVESETTANREPLVLTETEQQLVNALLEQSKTAGRTFNFDEVKPTFIKYDITEDRAKLVWMDNLQ
jgi:hypothetical protein